MFHTCNVCGRWFIYASILKLHYRSHTGEKPFKCVFCSKSFSHEAHLIAHRRIHLQMEGYASQLYNYTFLEKLNPEQHYELDEGERKYVSRKQMLLNEIDLNPCGTSNQLSKNCSVSVKRLPKNLLPNENGLNPHSAISSQAMKACSVSIKRLPKNMLPHGIDLNPCVTSNQALKNCSVSIERLSKNLLSNENGLKSSHVSKKCSISKKGFSRNLFSNKPTQSNTKKYKRSILEYSCDVCGKKSSNKNNLTMHYRIHTKEKPYVCNLCGKAYTRNYNLKLHYRVHTERPFACDSCGKAFDMLKKLKSHCCSSDK